MAHPQLQQIVVHSIAGTPTPTTESPAVPLFYGTTDPSEAQRDNLAVEDFLDLVERLAAWKPRDFPAATDKIWFVVTRLRGRALATYNSYDDATKNSWPALTKQLKADLSVSMAPSVAAQQLRQAKQTAHTSVRDYFAAIQKLVLQAYPKATTTAESYDQALRTHFIAGLRADLQENVQRQLLQKTEDPEAPPTASEVLKLATDEERLQQAMQAMRRLEVGSSGGAGEATAVNMAYAGNSAAPPPGRLLTDADAQAVARFMVEAQQPASATLATMNAESYAPRQQWQNQGRGGGGRPRHGGFRGRRGRGRGGFRGGFRNSGRGRSNIECYSCGRYGHMARDCRQPNRRYSRSQDRDSRSRRYSPSGNYGRSNYSPRRNQSPSPENDRRRAYVRTMLSTPAKMGKSYINAMMAVPAKMGLRMHLIYPLMLTMLVALCTAAQAPPVPKEIWADWQWCGARPNVNVTINLTPTTCGITEESDPDLYRWLRRGPARSLNKSLSHTRSTTCRIGYAMLEQQGMFARVDPTQTVRRLFRRNDIAATVVVDIPEEATVIVWRCPTVRVRLITTKDELCDWSWQHGNITLYEYGNELTATNPCPRPDYRISSEDAIGFETMEAFALSGKWSGPPPKSSPASNDVQLDLAMHDPVRNWDVIATAPARLEAMARTLESIVSPFQAAPVIGGTANRLIQGDIQLGVNLMVVLLIVKTIVSWLLACYNCCACCNCCCGCPRRNRRSCCRRRSSPTTEERLPLRRRQRQSRVFCTDSKSRRRRRALIQIQLNGKPIIAMADTGADTTTVTYEWARKNLDMSKVQPSDLQIVDFAGIEMPSRGKITTELRLANGKEYKQTVYLVDTTNDMQICDMLLGSDVLQDHKLNLGLDYEKKCVQLGTAKHVLVEPQWPDREQARKPSSFWTHLAYGVICLAAVAMFPGADAAATGTPLLHVPPVTNNAAAIDRSLDYVAKGYLERLDREFPPHRRTQDEQRFLDIQLQKLSQTAGVKPKDQMRLRDLLRKYSDVFSASSEDIGTTHLIEHTIELTNEDVTPVAFPPSRVSLAKEDRLRKKLKELRKAGVIEYSRSPWSARLVCPDKPDGSIRVTTDFRPLNEVTKRDAQPLPRASDLADALHGAKYISTMDLTAGYFQIAIAKQDREKTAFATPFGDLMQYRKMAMGLCNSPATFSRLMMRLFGDLLPKRFLMLYLDDICVYSKTFNEHLQHLETVFKRLRTARLKLKPQKTQLCQFQLKYLGFVVDGLGVRPDPSKAKVIRQSPRPTNTTELRRFMGMINFYRRLLPNLARIAKPLNDLLGKGGFKWTEGAEQAWKRLRDMVQSDSCVSHPDMSRPFIVQCDASNDAAGAVLLQPYGRDLIPVAFGSRTFNKQERQYSVTERECLAVLYSLKEWGHYLSGRPATIQTDHAALQWLFRLKEPTGRLARWVTKLQEHAGMLTIEYIKGAKNVLADFLSRAVPAKRRVRFADQEGGQLATDIRPKAILAANLRSQFDRMRKEQLEDPEVRDLIQSIEKGTQADAEFKLNRGVLHRNNQMYIPKQLRLGLLTSLHNDGGHFGIAKTLATAQGRFFWPGMKRDVTQWISACRPCIERKGPTKNRRNKAPLQPIEVPGPWHMVGCDIIGPLGQTARGNRFIVTFADSFTKFALAVPVPDHTAETVARLFVERIVLVYGAPVLLLTDQGAEFRSELMRTIERICKVHHRFTLPYKPSTNGLTERWNGTLCNIIGKLTHSNDWDQLVHAACFAYNNSVHVSTGFSPNLLNFGRVPRPPGDESMLIPASPYTVDLEKSYAEELLDSLSAAWKAAEANTKESQARQKRSYDKDARLDGIKVGDMVARKVNRLGKDETQKFGRRWQPDLLVTKVQLPHVWIRPTGQAAITPERVHVNDLGRIPPGMGNEDVGPAAGLPRDPVAEAAGLPKDQAGAVGVAHDAAEQNGTPGNTRTVPPEPGRATPPGAPTDDTAGQETTGPNNAEAGLLSDAQEDKGPPEPGHRYSLRPRTGSGRRVV